VKKIMGIRRHHAKEKDGNVCEPMETVRAIQVDGAEWKRVKQKIVDISVYLIITDTINSLFFRRNRNQCCVKAEELMRKHKKRLKN
jgi:hypothetical protein